MNKSSSTFRYLFTRVTSVFATSIALCGAASAGIITDDPTLPPCSEPVPPIECAYVLVNPPVTYLLPGLGLVIELFDILHFGFTNIQRFEVGAGGEDELEVFDSTVTGNLSINGVPQGPVTLAGSVQTIVSGKTGNLTGTFQTEMVALDLIGGGIMVRESPTLQSLGQTSIEDLGGGLFRIDSFFDIFTEISLDDGVTWTAATDAERVELQAVPEPESLALLAAALVLVGWGKRRSPTGC